MFQVSALAPDQWDRPTPFYNCISANKKPFQFPGRVWEVIELQRLFKMRAPPKPDRQKLFSHHKCDPPKPLPIAPMASRTPSRTPLQARAATLRKCYVRRLNSFLRSIRLRAFRSCGLNRIRPEYNKAGITGISVPAPKQHRRYFAATSHCRLRIVDYALSRTGIGQPANPRMCVYA